MSLHNVADTGINSREAERNFQNPNDLFNYQALPFGYTAARMSRYRGEAYSLRLYARSTNDFNYYEYKKCRFIKAGIIFI